MFSCAVPSFLPRAAYRFSDFFHINNCILEDREDIGKQRAPRKASSETKEGDVRKQPDRITQPESENSTDEIGQQNRIGKQDSENNTNTIRKQERENQKTKQHNHASVLPTNPEVKEGRVPFTPRFWPETER